MDEPMPNVRPDGADQEERSASLGPDEWTTSLNQLRQSLESSFSEAASQAVREARNVVASLERQGTEVLKHLDERRRAALEEEQALLGRVSQIQADLEAVHTEIQQSREQAEREQRDILESARGRADRIVADAEARATESDERRRAAEEQEHQLLGRLAQLEANLESVEGEIRRTREQAEREAEEILESARRQVDEIISDAEARATELDERRDRAEQQEQQILARVASLESDLQAVEAEIGQTRQEAQHEADEVIEAARRRGDAIIADAEARAAEIIASARAQAAGGRGSSELGAGTGAGSRSDVYNRLRGLAARVGQLLQTPPPALATSASAPPRTESAQPIDTHDDEDVDAHPAPVVRLDSRARTETPAEYHEPVVHPAAQTAPYPTTETEGDARSYPEVEPPSSGHAEPDMDEEDEPVTEPALHPAPEAYPEPVHVQAVPPPPPPPAPSAEPEAEEAELEPAHAAGGPVTQTVIFQSVPNFQAALALERSLKAMPDVREVRVADFDERQLTFQVTHELGDGLARVLLSSRGSELQLVEARADRVELAFRS